MSDELCFHIKRGDLLNTPLVQFLIENPMKQPMGHLPTINGNTCDNNSGSFSKTGKKKSYVMCSGKIAGAAF